MIPSSIGAVIRLAGPAVVIAALPWLAPASLAADPALRAPHAAPASVARAAAVSPRTSVTGVVRAIDPVGGAAVVDTEDEPLTVRATPTQLAALAAGEEHDLQLLRVEGTRWLVQPAPPTVERGPRAEFVLGTVDAIDLGDGVLAVADETGESWHFDGHPMTLAKLRPHQEVVVVAEHHGDRLWVLAVRAPDPAELLEASKPADHGAGAEPSDVDPVDPGVDPAEPPALDLLEGRQAASSAASPLEGLGL